MDLKILKQLEEINKKLANVVTKDDAKKFAMKNDLENLVTKDDLKTVLANYPTKNDLREQLQKQTEVICEDIGKVVNGLFTETDKLKADRSDVADLDERVTKLERKAKIN